MTGKFRIAVGLLLVFAFGVWLALRQREPVYQGRPVRLWVEEGYAGRAGSNKPPQKIQKANEAVHGVGVGAVPFYLSLLEVDESTPLKTKLRNQTWIHLDFGKLLGIGR